MFNLLKGTATVIATASEPIRDPIPRPRRASVLYRTAGGELWLAHMDASRNFRLKTAPGRTGPARWTPDGRTVLYLNYPADGRAHTLREVDPDTGEDRLIASTTQFVQFSSNSDASVFVGASGSKASPYVLLLIRAARRELTLCEHRAMNPSEVAPVFSPNSQRVYFQSDRHGKPALYSMAIEKLVEKTDEETA
jgi:oligogalacturonide lyase